MLELKLSEQYLESRQSVYDVVSVSEGSGICLIHTDYS